MSTPQELFLAIDTSGAEAGLVLSGGGRTDAASLATGPGGSARTEDLADVARSLFESRGASPADLTLVGAVVGPGSYTGLRSGLAFLRGLSFDGSARAVGVGSLELLAWRAARPGESVLAVSDAGAGRYALARYTAREADIEEEVAPAVVEAAACIDFVRDAAATVAVLSDPGSASSAPFVEAAAACGVAVRNAEGRSLERLAALVESRARRGLVVRVSDLLPLYVGEARAKPNRNRVAVREATE